MKNVAFALTLVLSVAGCNKGGGSGKAPEPTTEDQKTFYAIGLMLGRNIAPFNLTPEEVELVKSGISDSVKGGKTKVELDAYAPKIQALARTRAGARAESEKAKSKEFVEKKMKESGAVKTDSGMVFRTLKPGSGEMPKATDRVKVHYTGTLTDGTVFDSSVKRGEPAEFPLTGVIPCWTEGVQKMKVGEKAELVCPSAIAYGDRGRPPTIPGGATLVFEVELLEIKAPQPATQLVLPGASGAPGAHPAVLGGAHPAVSAAPAAKPSAKPAKPATK